MGPEHIEGFENMLNSNVDLSNPKFRGYPQAEVARKLKGLYDNHIWGEKMRAALTQCGNYVNHVQKIMEGHTLQFKNKDNVKKAGEAEQFDDITMLCFRYLGESFEK